MPLKLLRLYWGLLGEIGKRGRSNKGVSLFLVFMLLKWEALALWLSRVVPFFCYDSSLSPQYPPEALSDQAAHTSVNTEMHRQTLQCSHRQRESKCRVWQKHSL